jgi:tetratricopeptide (TPR) repeat protein
MKIWILFLLAATLLLLSCSGRDSNGEATGSRGTSWSDDTVVINKSLDRLFHHEIENTDSARKVVLNAEASARRIGYSAGLARALFEHGNLLYRENKYKEAIDKFTEALNLAKKLHLSLIVANSLERMASVNLTLGDDNLALKLYYEVLPLYEQLGDKEGIADVYNIIGTYKSSQGEYDTAQKYLAKAIQLNTETGNKTGLIHNKANLAFMYQDLGKNDKAQELYTEIIPQLIEAGNSTNLATVYYHVSIYFQWNSQPDSSLVYLHKAMEITERIADKSLFPSLYGMTGLVLLDMHQNDSASYYLTKSLALAKEVNDYFTQAQSLKLLVKIDTLKGDYRKATRKYEEILKMNDSLFKQRINNNLESSELRYENQKKSNFIAIQKIELKSSTRQKQLLFVLFMFLVFLSLLLVSLIILNKRNNKRTQELLFEKLRFNELQLENARHVEEINKLEIANAEKMLSIRKSELVSNALALEQKNELLGQINNKLNEAMTGDGTLRLKDLNGIVSAIRSQVNITDTFNQKFSQLHHDFFNDLKMSHPVLTKSELKFCAYLKLHLSSNQIAAITNVTLEAIRKTRYRIRKKLNLPAGKSLEDYISGF